MPNVPLGKSGIRKSVWAKTDGKCWYCGEQTNPWGDFCIDHFKSSASGGTDDSENLVPSCGSCNRKKGGLTVEQFRGNVSKLHGSVFTPAQIAFLQSKGIEPPEPERHIFFYEKMGLKA